MALYGVLIWTLSVLVVIGCVVLFALVRFVVPRRRHRRRRVQRGAASGSGARPAASRAARRSSTSLR